MTKSTRKSPKSATASRQAARRAARLSGGCWVDIFEHPWFQGKMLRVFGPATFQDALKDARPAGSLIVGPEARVVHLDAQSRTTLRPRQVVSDLSEQDFAAQLKSFAVMRVTKSR